MRDKYFYEVMFDDTSIDVSKEVGLVWSIANSLRGAYTSDKYKDVIIPMVIIRRFEIYQLILRRHGTVPPCGRPLPPAYIQDRHSSG